MLYWVIYKVFKLKHQHKKMTAAKKEKIKKKNAEARRNSMDTSKSAQSGKAADKPNGTKSSSSNSSKLSAPAQPRHQPHVRHQVQASLQSTVLLLVGALSVVLLGVLSHYELDDLEDTVLVNKTVALTKSRAQMFTFLSKMENMREWVPGIKRFEPIDSATIGIGKHYTESYEMFLFGTVSSRCVVVGYESPTHISWLSDNWLLTRTVWTLNRRDTKDIPTGFTITIYSRKKSLLFTHIISPFASFYYSQATRQALLSLRFHFQQNIMGL